MFYDSVIWTVYFCFVFSMAVPFVQGWDLVQTLGEGAYGEYESSFVLTTFIYFLFCHSRLTR